jgi:hypothetical protein
MGLEAAGVGAIMKGVGAVAGGVGSAMSGGGGGDSGRLKYTPEQAIEMLNWHDGVMSDLDQVHDSLTTAIKHTDERMGMLADYTTGMLPEAEFMKSLTENAQEIAAAFAGDTLAAIQAGFIDEASARYAGLIEEREGQVWNTNQAELDKLRAMESEDYRDPRYEAQIANQRKQLEQSLQRQGVSPAQRAMAMQQFEAQVEQGRVTNKEQMLAGATERTLARVGINQQGLSTAVGSMQVAANVYLAGRQQRLQEAVTGAQAVQGMLNYGQQTAGNIASLLMAQADNQYKAMQMDMDRINTQSNLWDRIGKTDFGKTTKQLLESGTIGPGSVYDQTGVPRSRAGYNVSQNRAAEQKAYDATQPAGAVRQYNTAQARTNNTMPTQHVREGDPRFPSGD